MIRNQSVKPKTATGGFTFVSAITNTVTYTDDIGNLTITPQVAQFIDLGQYVQMEGMFTFTTTGAVTQVQIQIEGLPSTIDFTATGQYAASGLCNIRCGTSAATSVQMAAVILAGSPGHLQIYGTLNTATSGASANTHIATWHVFYKKGN